MVIAFCVYYELNMNVLNMTIFNLYNSLAYISSGDNYPQPFTKYAKVALFKKSWFKFTRATIFENYETFSSCHRKYFCSFYRN